MGVLFVCCSVSLRWHRPNTSGVVSASCVFVFRMNCAESFRTVLVDRLRFPFRGFFTPLARLTTGLACMTVGFKSRTPTNRPWWVRFQTSEPRYTSLDKMFLTEETDHSAAAF